MASFPYPLHFVLANHQRIMGKVLVSVNRMISTYLINEGSALTALTNDIAISMRSLNTIERLYYVGVLVKVELHYLLSRAHLKHLLTVLTLARSRHF